MQNVAVVTGKRAIDLVVGAHDGAEPRLVYPLPEAGVVNLMQRSFRDDFVNSTKVRKMADPVPILVVGHEVLQHRNDVVRLESCSLGGCHLTREEGIFSVGLGGPAPMPGAHDVQGRPDDLRKTFPPPLLCQGLPEPCSHVAVPCGRDGYLVWKGSHANGHGRWRAWERTTRNTVRAVRGVNLNEALARLLRTSRRTIEPL